ncbi:hypothetical protein ISN44_As06g004440 [Arabidopsis suecica]|uniref:Uncharacterized protein n=1 Tax=Arabidopsis suecica TaxID=45249 RepID=A0A8T2C8S2_ARASU|nr:hypothetical protein ISN44_As06g004440 [Arabidopsis suecica]
MEEGKGCIITVIIVCIVLTVGLDIVAGFVGLQAQAAQQYVKHDKLECKAPSKTAFVLGIIAVSCLATAHVSANVIGCSISNLFQALGALPKNKITTYFNMACLFLIWVVGIFGALILANGIWSNTESRIRCRFTNNHVFSIGGKVCFLHGIVSGIYYISSIVARARHFHRTKPNKTKPSELKPIPTEPNEAEPNSTPNP